METTLTDDALEPAPETRLPLPAEVILEDGTRRDISGLQVHELKALQWEQERAFARRILAAPKGSNERAEAVRLAYDTAITIRSVRIAADSASTVHEPVRTEPHPRCQRLVGNLLSRWRVRGEEPRFFEIGFGDGAMLKRVSERGFPVFGIEVAALMRDQACQLLGPGHEHALLAGEFVRYEFAPEHRYHLIYWNDVFEHIPPDEIADYLKKAHDLLVPGGQLVTVTPNWHARPTDITREFCPPRTDAAGLHLKEYTLREVTGLLHRAGFRRVATPLFVTYERLVQCGDGLVGLKRTFEPGLEWMPFRLARLLCTGLGLHYTVATKDH